MKHILAYLLCMGLVSGIKAQITDSLSTDPSYSCYYIDKNSFQCDKREEMDIRENPQLEKDNRPEREKKFNPNKENLNKSKNTPKEVQHKYNMPEQESDSGILEGDGSIEVDSSTIIKQSSIDNRYPSQKIKSNEPPVTAGKDR